MNHSILSCSRTLSSRRQGTSELSNRSGVALILVIGLLALMMVMGVTFSIFMRTERTAAGSFRYGVVTRQLLHVALNRAVEEIDQSVTNIYPTWSCLESGATNGDLIINATNRLVMTWIPQGALVDNRSMRPRWIDAVPSSGGRVGFLAVNCSGLLDANAVGGTNRSLGTNAMEIQLADLPEMSNLSLFFDTLPFQTVQEMSTYGVTAGIFGGPVTNLVAFSYAPTQTVQACAFVGGTEGGWDRAQIVQAFQNAGLSDPAWADLAYDNLRDFVDTNSLPQRLDAGCVEAVPMVNEVDMDYRLTVQADSNWSAIVRFQIEYAYPFVTQSPLSFDLQVDWVVSVVDGGITNPLSQSSATLPLGALQTYSAQPVPDITVSGGPLRVFPAQLLCTLRTRILNGGVAHDAVPAGTASPITLQASMVSAPMSVESVKWTECIDPRFNWDPDDRAQWVPGDELIAAIPAAAPTPNSINEVTSYFLFPSLYGRTADQDYDGDLLMHVANAPLRTVGELGYICYAPLRTIRLYAHSGAPDPHPESAPYHRVVDYFTVDPNRPTHGLVNPNSRTPDVLTAVFENMPTQDFEPNEADWDATRLTRTTASAVASNVIAQGPYETVAELGRIDWSSFVSGPHNELVNESFIRNTSGLLSCRQNFFTVFLYAQESRVIPGSGSRRADVGDARAVAEIWRDPMTNAIGRHTHVVHLFKMLNSN